MIDPATISTVRLSEYPGPPAYDNLSLPVFIPGAANYTLPLSSIALSVNTYTKTQVDLLIQQAVNNLLIILSGSKTVFKVGDEGFPQNGDTEYTNEAFQDRDLVIITSFKTGALFYGQDYKRQKDGEDNILGPTIVPLIPNVFSEGDEWTIIASLINGVPIVPATSNMIRMNTVSGKTATHPDLFNREVASVVLTNGTTLLQGWTKPLASDTLTLQGANSFLNAKPIIINLL